MKGANKHGKINNNKEKKNEFIGSGKIVEEILVPSEKKKTTTIKGQTYIILYEQRFNKGNV